MPIARPALLCLLLVAGCGAAGSGGDGGVPADAPAGDGATAGDGAHPGDGARPGDGGTTGGDAGGPLVRACYAACQTPADCATTAAYMDADNYACTGGTCRYLGCNSDAECQTIGPYACRATGGGTPYCVHTCSVPADCSAGVAYMDADNYACEAGVCRYTGCNSDAECQTLGAWVCR